MQLSDASRTTDLDPSGINCLEHLPRPLLHAARTNFPTTGQQTIKQLPNFYRIVFRAMAAPSRIQIGQAGNDMKRVQALSKIGNPDNVHQPLAVAARNIF